MSVRVGPQAATFDQSYPMPTFASVSVEFADGTFREFHVHKPLRADVTVTTPLHRSPVEADLGALPVELIAPTLPEVEVRLKAGLAPHGAVMAVDSRAPDPRTDRARMLALLAEASGLRGVPGNHDRWREWERKTSALLGGESR